MSLFELFLVSCMLTALLALRIGLPVLCTWSAGCIMRRLRAL